MVFLAEQTIPVPPKDIVSWIFDEVPYDQDQPVSNHTFRTLSTKGLNIPRITAEHSNLQDLHRCCQPRQDSICKPRAHDYTEIGGWLEEMGYSSWPEGRCMSPLIQRRHVTRTRLGHYRRWRYLCRNQSLLHLV